jgi:Ca2+-binding EF-hand superfamily protein
MNLNVESHFMRGLKFLLIFMVSAFLLTACKTTSNKSTSRFSMGSVGFNSFDLNGDGFVTEDEITACYLQSFVKMDRDSDGVIDAEEEEEAVKKNLFRFKGVTPSNCKYGFQVKKVGRNQFVPLIENYDKNKDGVLNESEFLSIHSKSKEAFLGFDSNGDAKITEDEALQFVKSQMPKLYF